ncbi:hypothetical protein PAPHI01_1376 [Pancytospora philotis]|nr:hypothetical protein PAPHI01_1376 [Pancytospora philotis]
MELEKQLLSDYGTIPQAIGLCLLKNNSATLDDLRRRTALDDTALRDGLAIMIQRRIVKFFIFEKSVRYCIDRRLLRRRLYFPIYMCHVARSCSSKHLDLFGRVLARGVLRVAEECEEAKDLLESGVLQHEVSKATGIARGGRPDGSDAPAKARRTGNDYLIVNFDHLDSKIFAQEAARYVAKRYNEAAGDVFRAVLRCEQVNKASILGCLKSSKLLILDNGAVINEKDNVDEYLRYLCSSRVLEKGTDQSREYFVNTNPRYLKLYRIGLMLSDPASRRLFNMIAHGSGVEDKALTVSSLLSVNKIKEAVLQLQGQGLLQQICNDEYRGNSKVEHSWAVDLSFTSRMVLRQLETAICEKLQHINECWDVNYFMDNAEGNESVWMSDLISLATDHLIMSLE